jgi:hypothetical protein
MKLMSCKGGGARGLLSARLGERLELVRPGWDDKVDVRAGTSTGGILALGRAAGVSWSELVGLYREKAKVIFADTWWDNLGDLSVGGYSLRGAQYSPDGLRSVLEEIFGDRRLGELDCDVLIPALDLDGLGTDPRSWKAKFFNRRHDPQERVVDVAMRTAAAPTYFPTYQGYADGGVIANDPSVCALAYALKELVKNPGSVLKSGGVSLLCLGTGKLPKFIEGEGSKDWGGIQWARHLVDVLMDGGMMAPVYQAAAVLRGRYHQLNPDLPREIALDGEAWKGEEDLEESLIDLVSAADGVDLEETVAWLEIYGWAQ